MVGADEPWFRCYGETHPLRLVTGSRNPQGIAGRTPNSKRYVHAFLMAYNFAKRLKTLRDLTPYEHICKVCTTQPNRYRLNQFHHTVGLNIYSHFLASEVRALCWLPIIDGNIDRPALRLAKLKVRGVVTPP